MLRPPPSATLFPYTTLFRSLSAARMRSLFGPDPGEVARTTAFLRGHGLRRTGGGLLTRTFAGSTADVEARSEEHTSELQSHVNLVCRLLLEKKKNKLSTALT